MDILNTLLEISVYSVVIYCAIMLFKKALGSKLSSKLHLALWGLLILRLLIPVTLESSVHFFTVENATVPAVENTHIAPTKHDQPQGNMQPSSNANQNIVPDTTSLEAIPATANTRTPVPSAIRTNIKLEHVLLAIWLIGMVASTAIAVYSYHILRQKAKQNYRWVPNEIYTLFQECKAALNIRGDVKIRLQHGQGSPVLMFPSTVILPSEMLSRDTDCIRMALLHELSHYKRKDQLLSMLLLGLRIVYWFNPVVWLAVPSIREDMETACDNMVVQHLQPGARVDYAQAILSMYTSDVQPQMALSMMGGTRKNVEQRIKGLYLQRYSKPTIKLVAVLMGCAVVVTCFTTACQPTPEQAAVVDRRQPIEEKAETAQQNYSAPQRWEDSIKFEGITVNADADIELPEEQRYQVSKLTYATFTQQRADELIAYLADGNKMAAADNRTTKAEYQQMIIEAKRGSLIDGDYVVTPDSEAWVAELEQRMAEAPEKRDVVYVENPEFSTNISDSGEMRPEYGENSIHVDFLDENDKPIGYLYISRYDPDATVVMPNRVTYFGASDYRDYLDDPTNNILMEYNGTGVHMSEEEKQRNANFEELTQQMDYTDQQAAEWGQNVLDNLGITGLEVYKINKVLLSKEANNYQLDRGEYARVYRVVYRRPSGALMPVVADFNAGQDLEGETDYAAPTYVEELSIIFTAEGNIWHLSWDSEAELQEVVTENAELLPFDEIQTKFADYMRYCYAARDYVGSVNVVNVKLVAAYASPMNDRTGLLLVPAWQFTIGEIIEHERADTAITIEARYLVNAIDGGLILSNSVLQE